MELIQFYNTSKKFWTVLLEELQARKVEHGEIGRKICLEYSVSGNHKPGD